MNPVIAAENPILWDTWCHRCGTTNENHFSWDGVCLRCEDEDDFNYMEDSDMEAR